MNFDGINHLIAVLSPFGSFLKNACAWFVSIAPTVDGICMSLITYYTFRLTVFPKKLKFISFKMDCSVFDGDSLEIILENRALCPTVIESVDLIVDSKKIQFFRGECIVEGFKTAKIEMPRYSQIISGNGPIDIDICNTGNISLLVKTTRGSQHIQYKSLSKIKRRRIQKLESNYEGTTVCRNQYGDKIVVPGVRYAISYLDQHGNTQIVFIHKSGAMSAAPFGYNRLPIELTTSEAAVRSHFDEEFAKHNLSYHLKVFCEPFPSDTTGDLLSNQPKENL